MFIYPDRGKQALCSYLWKIVMAKTFAEIRFATEYKVVVIMRHNKQILYTRIHTLYMCLCMHIF